MCSVERRQQPVDTHRHGPHLDACPLDFAIFCTPVWLYVMMAIKLQLKNRPDSIFIMPHCLLLAP